jgi:hypothetical protein
MTSLRQLTANRLNALKSTGPRTEEGKQQSRRNSLRHGLTAETVIGSLEDLEDYKEFEAAIIADYDAQTAVERELVLRLASLLWRSRRAIAIETSLFRIHAQILRERKAARVGAEYGRMTENVSGWPERGVHLGSEENERESRGQGNPADDQSDYLDRPTQDPSTAYRVTAHCFLRLANLDSRALERLTRYEVALWRQTVQTLFALQMIRRRL